MGDEGSIREIISEVDADNVSYQFEISTLADSKLGHIQCTPNCKQLNVLAGYKLGVYSFIQRDGTGNKSNSRWDASFHPFSP